MNHIIQKQTFEFSAPNLKSGHAWEGKLQPLLRDVINPCIEKYFDRVSSAEADLIIDQLEINLGPLDKLSDEALASKVESELSRQINWKHNAPSEEMKLDFYRSLTAKGNSSGPNILPALSHHKKHLICFLHFLEHGNLPWWVEHHAIDLQGSWIDELSPEEIALVSQQLSRFRYTLDRLIYQFDHEFLGRLIQHYLPQEFSSVMADWNWLARRYVPTDDNGQLHKVYWYYWLNKSLRLSIESTVVVQAISDWMAVAIPSHHESFLFLRSAGVLPDDEDPDQPTLQRESPENFNAVKSPTEWLKTILRKAAYQGEDSRGLLKNGNKTILGSGDVDPKAVKAQSEEAEEAQELKEAKEAQEFNEAQEVKEPNEDEIVDSFGNTSEALYTPLAGLVLIHPFLTELFQTTQLWNRGQWVSVNARQQAVLLLGWIAFGETTVPEHQMIIPKLLCGMPWAEPLDNRVGLPSACMESGIELLNAIIQHWRALGNTSAEGLREGFLQRHGKCIKKNEDWHLTIEKKTQDILLNKLPWGISLIHLPWLNKTKIYVEWI